MSDAQKTILLDGSMGQEIVNRGGKGDYGEWAVAALHENPALVYDIHCDYLRAGADVITTNTYATTRTRLRHVGMEDQLGELARTAGELACRSRDEAGTSETKIAASLPPLEASYISEFALSFAQASEQYAELIHLLSLYVDILLGETFSTSFEARAFMAAAQGSGKTVWLAYTLDDARGARLRGGESLSDAIDALGDNLPDALLVNCCRPPTIQRALPILAATGLPFGAYANDFVEIPATWVPDGGVGQLWTAGGLSPDIYAAEVAGWLDAGARIAGGCCEIGPAHIARLRQMIDGRAKGRNP